MNILSTLLTIFIILFQSQAFALTPAEVACNKSLNDNNANQAITQADALLKDNPNNEHAWTCKGRAYYLLDQTDEALNALSEAVKNGRDDYEKAFATLLQGHVYRHSAQTDTAIKHYEMSLDFATKAKHQALMFNNHLNIGIIHFDQALFEQALDRFNAAHALAGNDDERGDTLARLSATYFALSRYDEAVEYQLKTQIMMEKVGTLDQFADASINLGRYYFANDREIDAEHALNKIIKFAQDQGGAYYEAKASYVLAVIRAAQKQEAEARSLIAHAKNIARKTNDKALQEEIEQATESLFK